MAELVVSAATGALKPLLEKLAASLVEEYKRYKGVPGEIDALTKELEAMHAYLLKMSEVENPDVQDEACMKEVRELSYDMEDCVDEFLLRIGDKADTPDGLISKLKNMFITKPKTRHQIAKVIEKLKIQVKEMGERNARYRMHETISKTSSAHVDRRALAIFDNASKLVGLDRPKKELIEHLTKEDGLVPLQRPKVISVVGSGGSGKTTLANQVYQELKVKEKSECHAFVSVSRSPDYMNILQNILCQLSDDTHPNLQAWSMQLLIMKINDTLRNKRYLIVIDDIWTKEAWETINSALYKNDKGSKVITTTRVHDVAKACCSADGGLVYVMKPLGSEDSKKLFFERLFGSEDKCPTHLRQMSDKILEKCDGLPLAIISISGLLASKAPTEDEWCQVQNSIGRGIEKNSDVQSMMQILSLSYFDLPHYLKTCLLYLSVFPEDSIIDKKRLVRRWIAEGFIQSEQRKTLYQLGEMCFNELINRSLIQAQNINMYGEVIACQIHDTILDFIVSKSEEENFISVFGDGYQMHGQHSKVRRLSINVTSEEKASTLTQLDLSHVRSLTVFHYSFELPLWTNFYFLRVLDLQGCRQVQGYHLTDIGKLFQLKYLSLRKTDVCELPEQIWKLKYLETLDLKETKVTKIPSDIALQGLVYLAVDEGVKLPDEPEIMRALEDLDCVDIFKQSVNFLKNIEQLKNLRNIRLFLSTDNGSVPAEGNQYKQYMNDVASSLCKLSRLHSLSIDGYSRSTEDFSLDSAGRAPTGLQILQITGCFISKVPNWVRHLSNLQNLTLYVKEFEVEDVIAIGRELAVLVFLRLVAHQSFHGRRITISGADGFHSLRHFDYGCAIPLSFEAGAMPQLEKLTLMFDALKTILLVRNENFHFGIQHLFSLKSLHCLLHMDKEAITTWTKEKMAQLVDMSCELAKAAIDEIEDTLEQVQYRAKKCILTAGCTHLNPPKLTLQESYSWRIETDRNTFLKRVSEITRLLFKNKRTFSQARRMLKGVKLHFNRRISNCPLQGNGNRQCQGLPETNEGEE